MDIVETLKSCEDYLFPAKKMTVRERSLYYHLFRHTRVVGKEVGLFAIMPLSTALGIGEGSVRDDVRSLHERGCIRIEERSRIGHLIRVLLPDEIEGVIPKTQVADVVDLETIDFFSDRLYVVALLARENGACFYCLRQVRTDNCELDHIVARADRTDNSYRNIVVSCHECNTTKQAREASDFIRSLYRRGILSQSDLERRLSTLEMLQAGKLVPDIAAFPRSPVPLGNARREAPFRVLSSSENVPQQDTPHIWYSLQWHFPTEDMMNPTMKDLGIDRLDAEQRIALALEIWESLGDARPRGRLTAEQRAELARRDAELEANPGIALTWQQIRTGIEARP